jgi:diguanylate cyclase (GGDEF)-like protein
VNIDPRTLLVVCGLGSWILAASIEFLAVRPSRGSAQPDRWSLGLLAQGAGLLLVSHRGEIADLWSIPLANALLMSTPLFSYAALQKIRGAETHSLVFGLPLGVGVILPIVGFSDEAFPARVVVVLCAALAGLGLSCWSAAQIARPGRRAGAYLILGSTAILVTSFVAFAVSVVGKEVQGVLSGSGIQLAFYAMNGACLFLSTLGYMDLARIHRVELEFIADPGRPEPLTGLHSRYAFMHSGHDELERARRRGYPVCAMVLVVDRFERLEAAQGQTYADAALMRVARIVRKDVRTYDLAGRLARNSIGILLPEVPLATGIVTADRIRARVANDLSDADEGRGVRISVGVCEAAGAQGKLDAIVAEAEECVRNAQLEGGNRVVTPDGPGV